MAHRRQLQDSVPQNASYLAQHENPGTTCGTCGNGRSTYRRCRQRGAPCGGRTWRRGGAGNGGRPAKAPGAGPAGPFRWPVRTGEECGHSAHDLAPPSGLQSKVRRQWHQPGIGGPDNTRVSCQSSRRGTVPTKSNTHPVSLHRKGVWVHLPAGSRGRTLGNHGGRGRCTSCNSSPYTSPQTHHREST